MPGFRRTENTAGNPDTPTAKNQYDSQGRLIKTPDSTGRTTVYAYTSGRMSQVTSPDPDGSDPLTSAVTQYKYDANGRTSEIINAANQHEYFSYNTAGQVISATDFAGHTSQFTYDPRNGQVQTVTDPLNHVTSYDYDTLGRLTQVTDPHGGTTNSIYSATTGRLIQSKDADNNSTFYTYDVVGNLKTLKDPDNNLTTWNYNADNQPTSEITTDGTRSYTYDAVGNLTSSTDRDGNKRTFAYQYVYDGQPDYQVTDEKWMNGTQVARDIAYHYTTQGQLASVSDPSAAYSYTYDSLGRLQTVSSAATTGNPTSVLTYGYQPQSRQRTVSATVNNVADFLNTYTYDALGQVVQITQQGQGGNTVAPKRVDFAYNAVGQFSQIDRYADLGAQQPVADSAYSYTAAGDLQSLSYTQATGPAHTNPVSLAGYSWSYDSAGRITNFNSPDGTTSYTYDASGQLTSANHSNPTVQADEAYTYDANGNRTLSGYQTSTNNRLLSDGTYNYEYDQEGHRTQQTAIATGNFVTYAWDFRGRLTDVAYHTANGTVTKQVRYAYDAFDRLIRKDLDSNGDGIYESAESYVYDGENIVLVADVGTGSLTNRYLQGPGVDQVLADEQIPATSQTPNTVLWALADNQGTVRDWAQRNTTTGQTQIVDHVVYDAYGQILAQVNPQTGQASQQKIRYAYTGQIWDTDANLYNYRARWYDPHAGRFISEDPLGFAAGDTNVQRYVGNSVTNAIDPSGLERIHLPADDRGTWIAGIKGNGTFQYSDTAKNGVAGIVGAKVTFKNNYIAEGGFPSEWYYKGDPNAATVDIKKLVDGGKGDFGPADAKMRELLRDPNWERTEDWTWNHAGEPGSTKLELVDSNKHAAVAHQGPAKPVRADLRAKKAAKSANTPNPASDVKSPNQCVVAKNGPPDTSVKPADVGVTPGGTSTKPGGKIVRSVIVLDVYMNLRDALQGAGILHQDFQTLDRPFFFADGCGSVFVVDLPGFLNFTGSPKMRFVAGPRKGESIIINNDEVKELRATFEAKFGKYIPGSLIRGPKFIPGTDRKQLPIFDKDFVPIGYVDEDGAHYFEDPWRVNLGQGPIG
ncbi:MAG: wapA 3 [Planctomycetaceae bacterium]|nr:wapA 3 [Planctomycetaceae bacterium]